MSETKSPFYKSKVFNLTLGLSVTGGCIYWAFLTMAKDEPPRAVLAKIGAAFQAADYRTLPIMWGALALFYWLKAWRWTMLLKPLGSFTTRECLPPVLVGFAFNNLLPAHLGEFVRVFVFSRKHGVPKTAILSTVVLERIFDIVAILGFFFLGLVFMPDMDEQIRRVAAGFGIFVAVALAGALIYLIWTGPFVALVEKILAKLRFVPDWLRQKLCHILESGAEGLGALRHGTLLFHITWNSVLQWAFNGLMMHVSLWAFGIEVSPLASCLLLGAVAFGVTIPSSPGYFGVIQALFIAVINKKTTGIDNPEGVFAASIYFHMSQYIPVTLLGLYFFNKTGLSVSEVQYQAEEEQTDVPAEVGCSQTNDPPAVSDAVR